MTQTFDLAAARINAGFSRKGFARKLKIHERSLQRLEEGRTVRPQTAKPVADYFNLQVTDLIPISREAA